MTSHHPRPTSPHLQIYRLPLTGLISITHRITGVLLAAGIFLLMSVFYSLAQGEASYRNFQILAGYWLVKPVFWGIIFALFFHLCHGVRHLLWDLGKSFNPALLNLYATMELLCAAGLALLTWLLF
ncbi:MAG: succinate dehydrogenase, cytochrome b556 subunit [Gammaproteobacteria bacterium]|nr:succinate dehydrogenase, cytochrome b556 subunit [Gammaproteobacteria bacterium]